MCFVRAVMPSRIVMSITAWLSSYMIVGFVSGWCIDVNTCRMCTMSFAASLAATSSDSAVESDLLPLCIRAAHDMGPEA